jgi:hypothetical protein
VVTPTAITTACAVTRPAVRTLTKVASSQTDGNGSDSGRVRKRSTSASSSAQSRLTWLLLMPSMPKALTRSSTRRVETPLT